VYFFFKKLLYLDHFIFSIVFFFMLTCMLNGYMLLSDSFYKNLYNTDDNDKLSKKKTGRDRSRKKVCVYFENMKELLFFS